MNGTAPVERLLELCSRLHTGGTVAETMSLCCEGLAAMEHAATVACYLFDCTGEELELAATTGKRADGNGTAKIIYEENADDLLCFAIRSGTVASAGAGVAEAMRSVRMAGMGGASGRCWLACPLGLPGQPLQGGLLFGFDRTTDGLSAAARLYARYAAARLALLTESHRSRLAIQALERDLDLLGKKAGSAKAAIPGIVGNSEATRRLRSLIRKAAEGNATVLITGETGTGKELVATAIHQASARKDQPFVALNCAAIPESLLESELFGHEKNAFTGAGTSAPGLLRNAGNGTVLLDEVGDMPIALQAKILRFLQEKSVRPVGGTDEYPVHARVIAATNINLIEAVERGAFRRDLYHRLAVFPIPVLPLRERKEDILPIAEHFLRQFSLKYRRPRPALHEMDVRSLYEARFAGNVRELAAVIEREFASWNGVDPFRLRLGHEEEQSFTLPEAVLGFEKNLIRYALDRNEGNTQTAAQALGIPRRTLAYKLKSYGLVAEPEGRRENASTPEPVRD